jgi:hypothetical protein
MAFNQKKMIRLTMESSSALPALRSGAFRPARSAPQIVLEPKALKIIIPYAFMAQQTPKDVACIVGGIVVGYGAYRACRHLLSKGEVRR